MASYFCLSDGTVVHAVAGPLDAKQFLREAKWAAEVRKLAVAEAGGDAVEVSRHDPQGTPERLAVEHDVADPAERAAADRRRRAAGASATTSVLLPAAASRRHTGTGSPDLGPRYPLPKLSQLYPIVFEDVLKEKLSTLPVQTR